MKKIGLFILAIAVLSFVSSSCRHGKTPDQIRVAKYKPMADADGNHYGTTTLNLSPTTSTTPVPTGVSFTNEVMTEDLRTGATADGSLSKDASGLLIVGCFNNNKANCDTLGALYSAEKAIGQPLDQLAAATTTSGDANGDGFDDSSVAKALEAAGYDPNIYTITPLYDLANGYTGTTVNDTLPAGGYQSPKGLIVGSSSKTITYAINQKTGDTVYTPGAGLQPNGQPKILVPDLSKINFTTIKPVATTVKGSCPDGWHIPSDGEWKILEMALGMTAVDVNKEGIENDRGSNEGIGPKLAAQLQLKYAGYIDTSGASAQLGEVEAMWTSTGGKDQIGNYVWIRYIDLMAHKNKGVIRKKQYLLKSGFSIRCFKDTK
jgi:uncharacterized protein (TIGR02145 family)